MQVLLVICLLNSKLFTENVKFLNSSLDTDNFTFTFPQLKKKNNLMLKSGKIKQMRNSRDALNNIEEYKNGVETHANWRNLICSNPEKIGN